MFEHFTDTSRRAIAIANQETHRLRGNIIGDVEVLLGIMKGSTGVGVEVLRALGVNFKKTRTQLERQPRALDDGSAPSRLPQTREAKQAIEAAIAVAREMQHEHVGTQHIILGLLRYPDFASSRILSAQGVSFDSARLVVLNAMKAAKNPQA